jgi:hypothetical protein
MSMLAPQRATPSGLRGVGEMRCRRRLACELLASEREERGTVSAGEIAEVTDADEASGQHMLAEAARELARG